MNTVIPVEKTALNLEHIVQKGLLKETDLPAVGRFISYVQQNGFEVTDPAGWKAYHDHLKEPIYTQQRREKRRLSAGGFNNRIAAAIKLIRVLADHDPDLTPGQRAQIKIDSRDILKRAKPKDRHLTREKYITHDEVIAMIEEFKKPTWGLAKNRARIDMTLWTEFLWITGCRISEAINVLLSDIKPYGEDQCEILVHGKGNKDRDVYVPKELVDRIRSFFRGQDYLFESKHPGRKPKIRCQICDGAGILHGRICKECKGTGWKCDWRWSRQHVSVLISRCAQKVLGRPFGAHCLRHSFVQNALEKKVDIVAISKYVGHSNINTTVNFYAHSRLQPEQILELTALHGQNN